MQEQYFKRVEFLGHGDQRRGPRPEGEISSSRRTSRSGLSTLWVAVWSRCGEGDGREERQGSLGTGLGAVQLVLVTSQLLPLLGGQGRLFIVETPEPEAGAALPGESPPPSQRPEVALPGETP